MKIHLRKTGEKAEDWVQSPHIHRAITEGRRALCGISVQDEKFVNSDPAEVGCQACLMRAAPRLQTCDKCGNYAPPFSDTGSNVYWENAGECTRIGAWQGGPNAVDSCGSGECEGLDVPVYVGPKFGCIHWEKKPNQGEK